jgi:predicted small secreted protein
MLFTGCESLFYVDPEVIVGGSFIGGADKDIRSDDAFFYIQKANEDDLLWVAEYEALIDSDLQFEVIESLDEIKLPSTSFGTCFSIGGNYIVTNQHVINDNDNIYVLYNGEKLSATLVYQNYYFDLAILKIEDFCFPYSFKIADSTHIMAGQEIYTIGYPLVDVLGSDVRITNGIINAKSGLGNDKNSFQISAQIQPGNSGGPVVKKDSPGTVIGIATYKVSDSYLMSEKSAIGQNLNFANNCNELLNQIDLLNIDSCNDRVMTLDDAYKATGIVVTEPEHGKKLKKYIFSYDIKTVPDQYFDDMDHMQKLHIKLYSLDLNIPVASYYWAWAFDYQEAPSVIVQYNTSFPEFINFLMNAETETIKKPKDLDKKFLSDGEGTLIGLNQSLQNNEKKVVIPDSIDDEIITRIGMFAFAEDSKIQTVFVPEGVKLIDESAFYYCKNLKDIYLPQSLERIGPWALYGPSDIVIHYAGTELEWFDLTKGKKSLEPNYYTVLYNESY